MTSDDTSQGAWALGLVEGELFRIGGVGLLDDARIEARWYADLFHPWAGGGEEPLDRLAARIEILSLRAERSSGRRPARVVG